MDNNNSQNESKSQKSLQTFPEFQVDDSNEVLFHLFHKDINNLWFYFTETTSIQKFLYPNGIISSYSKGKIKEKETYEVKFPEKGISIKISIEDLIDNPNFKSLTYKSLNLPENLPSFAIILSFFFSTVNKFTGMTIKLVSNEMDKKNFIFEYLINNYKIVFDNIDKYIESNFNEYEESESICIERGIDKIFNFLTEKNYSNLKVLFGNYAKVRPTKVQDELEIEHFSTNNIIKLKVEHKKDYNEQDMLLKVISSVVPIPSQNISIKIVNINQNSCLVFFTHHLKEFIGSDQIQQYGLIKQKALWLLKSEIEQS